MKVHFSSEFLKFSQIILDLLHCVILSIWQTKRRQGFKTEYLLHETYQTDNISDIPTAQQSLQNLYQIWLHREKLLPFTFAHVFVLVLLFVFVFLCVFLLVFVFVLNYAEL